MPDVGSSMSAAAAAVRLRSSPDIQFTGSKGTWAYTPDATEQCHAQPTAIQFFFMRSDRMSTSMMAKCWRVVAQAARAHPCFHKSGGHKRRWFVSKCGGETGFIFLVVWAWACTLPVLFSGCAASESPQHSELYLCHYILPEPETKGQAGL